MTGALTEAITGRGVIADAVVAAKTMVRGDPTLQPVPADLEARIDQLGAIKATTGLSSFDYVSAGVALQDALSAGGAVALADVFGPGLYARRVGSQAGTFLAGAIGDPNGKDLDVKAMSQQLQNLLDELDDRSALFQLELDGTIERIASLRATIAATRHEATRKSLYAELAVLARRALQLNAAAKRVEAEDAKGTPPLGMALAKVGPDIAAIRQSSQTEKASQEAMGDDVGLLRDKELDYAGRWEAQPDAVVIQPEESFPAATANATDKMATTLADRVSSQESAVSTLKGRVIPTGRTFDDLKAAFGRYQAFLSPAGQSANPLPRPTPSGCTRASTTSWATPASRAASPGR